MAKKKPPSEKLAGAGAGGSRGKKKPVPASKPARAKKPAVAVKPAKKAKTAVAAERAPERPRKPALRVGGVVVKRGSQQDIRIPISETYSGDIVTIPVRVIRAKRPGPTVFVTAAVHGDEINGTGIVHELMFSGDIRSELVRGTLMLVPVVNIFGFENHERYLPDRRDLNRSFPGSDGGSLASRLASIVVRELIDKADYGIDLHSAAFQRTNFPNVRGDLSIAGVRRLAYAFGCAMVVDGKGPEGSFRRECGKRGCPAIILEAGEPWKMEPSVLEIGVRGVRNVLVELGMIEGELIKPPYLARVEKSTWVRAEVSGILKFHVTAGDLVERGQPVATNFSIFGKENHTLLSPADGIVMGIATLPAVKPGEPVCHIALPGQKLSRIRRALAASEGGLHQRVRRDLATNITVIDAPEGSTGA